jgi:hypothetical protein
MNIVLYLRRYYFAFRLKKNWSSKNDKIKLQNIKQEQLKKIHNEESFNQNANFLLLCFSFLFYTTKTLYIPSTKAILWIFLYNII